MVSDYLTWTLVLRLRVLSSVSESGVYHFVSKFGSKQVCFSSFALCTGNRGSCFLPDALLARHNNIALNILFFVLARSSPGLARIMPMHMRCMKGFDNDVLLFSLFGDKRNSSHRHIHADCFALMKRWGRRKPTPYRDARGRRGVGFSYSTSLQPQVECTCFWPLPYF